MHNWLNGTGVALVTPFLNNSKIDFKGLENVINHCINGGVEYLVALGTTGETATLSKAEKQEIINFCIKVIDNRVPLVAGFGGNNTQAIINDLNSFDLTGVKAILSSSPNYNKPTQEGIYQHYKAVAGATQLPVILYNVPSRTAKNVSSQTTLRLANDVENIIAIKEASGDIEQCMEIIKDKPDGFYVVSGEDLPALSYMSVGFNGVISVIAQGFPKRFSNMIRCGLNADFNTGKQLHYELMKITQLIFDENNPGGIKEVLAQLAICENNMRLPLVPVSNNNKQAIINEVKRLS